jgi:hypothetical protein
MKVASTAGLAPARYLLERQGARRLSVRGQSAGKVSAMGVYRIKITQRNSARENKSRGRYFERVHAAGKYSATARPNASPAQMVPGAGFAPATQGFSVPCSTELSYPDIKWSSRRDSHPRPGAYRAPALLLSYVTLADPAGLAPATDRFKGGCSTLRYGSIGCRHWICTNAKRVRAVHAAVTSGGKSLEHGQPALVQEVAYFRRFAFRPHLPVGR